MNRLPNNYTFFEEFPLSYLYTFNSNSKSRRGKVRLFIQKGIKCCTCGIICNRLVKTIHNKEIHIDLYNGNFSRMLTIGHIIPVSKGGSRRSIENMRPLCNKCNTEEGNCIDKVIGAGYFESHIKGRKVRKSNGKLFENGFPEMTVENFFEIDGKVFLGSNGLSYPANKAIFVKTS